MSVAKVIELSADGIQAMVSGNRAEKYRVNAKVTFVLDKT